MHSYNKYKKRPENGFFVYFKNSYSGDSSNFLNILFIVVNINRFKI